MNIFYIHCSCLIIIAEFKLKMSRSYCSYYDEEWQRRKSLLIRSLFHDIPILSPITEESNESSDYIPRRNIFDVPTRTIEVPGRPYSPLPPLIIEKEPNRHDEPEEYYRKLLTKIKRIYKKLFIENRDVGNDDFNSTLNDSFIDDDDNETGDNDLARINQDSDEHEIHFENDIDSIDDDQLTDNNDLANGNQDNRVTEICVEDYTDSDSINDDNDSKSSNSSDGYGADLESVESEIINVTNYTVSNEDEEMRSEEEESSNQIIDDHEMSEPEGSDNVNNKIKHESQASVDNQELTEQEFNESMVDNQAQKRTEENNHVKIDDQEKSNALRISYQGADKTEDSNRITSNGRESTENEKSNESENSDDERIYQDVEPRNIGVDKNQEMNDTTASSEEDADAVNESKLKFKEKIKTTDNKRSELDLSHLEALEEDLETNASSEGTDYRQITTEALVHVDGYHDLIERESRIYEDSVRSLILPTRQFKKHVEARIVEVEDKIEELSELEHNKDPKTVTTFDTVENEDISEQIEVMRSQQPKISQESIQITRCSNSDHTADEHTVLLEELRILTSSSQHGENNVAEHKASNDIEEILTSIFNESQNIEKEVHSSGRKRKLYEEVSVQTSEKVTWDDLRENLFVGTPKIFRLCACVDHICS